VGIFVGGLISIFYNKQNAQREADLAALRNKNLQSRSVNEKIADLTRFQTTEKPRVIKLLDMSLVEDMPLYDFAQEGDQLLDYSDMTIIYDEQGHRIVAMVPHGLLENQFTRRDDAPATSDSSVSDDSAAGEVTDAPAPQPGETEAEVTDPEPPAINIEVRNATSKAGYAGTIAGEIEDELGYDTTAANASKKDYGEIVLVDLTGGDYKAELAEVAQTIGATKVLTSIPTGEKSSTADFLVLLGK
jgi:hypothetical protein